jgi:pyruvate decarboxylase
MDAEYNDIQEWKFKDLLAVFGADPEKSKTFQVRNKQDVHDLFDDEEFSSAPYIQVWSP